MVFARKVNETSSTARSPPNSLTSWLISSMLPVLQHSTAGLLDFLFKRRNLVDGNHACGLHVAVDDRPDHHGRVDIAIFIELKRTRCTHILNRSEEHTSELQSLMRISYAVFCLKKK